MIVGIGINLIKNPIITNYPTINLSDVSKKKIKKKEIILKLKKIYENFIPKMNSISKDQANGDPCMLNKNTINKHQ